MARGCLFSVVAIKKAKVSVEDCCVTLELSRQGSVHDEAHILVLAKGHCLERLLGIPADKLLEHVAESQVSEGAIIQALSMKLIGQCVLISTDQCSDDRATHDSLCLLTDVKVLANDYATILSYPPFCHHFQTPRHVSLHNRQITHYLSVLGDLPEDSFNTSTPKLHQLQPYCNQSHQLLSWDNSIDSTEEQVQLDRGVHQTSAMHGAWTHDEIQTNGILETSVAQFTPVSYTSTTVTLRGDVTQTSAVTLPGDVTQTSAMTLPGDVTQTSAVTLPGDVTQTSGITDILSSNQISSTESSPQMPPGTIQSSVSADVIQCYTTASTFEESFSSSAHSWQHWCDVDDPVVTSAGARFGTDTNLPPRSFPVSSLASSISASPLHDYSPTELTPCSTLSPCDRVPFSLYDNKYSPCYYSKATEMVAQGTLAITTTPRNATSSAASFNSQQSLIGTNHSHNKTTSDNSPNVETSLSSVNGSYVQGTPELFDDPHINHSDSPELFPMTATPNIPRHKCLPKSLLPCSNRCTPDLL